MKGLGKDPVDDDDAKKRQLSTKTEGAKSKQKQKKKPKTRRNNQMLISRLSCAALRLKLNIRGNLAS
jgi:hypothetical protein